MKHFTPTQAVDVLIGYEEKNGTQKEEEKEKQKKGKYGKVGEKRKWWVLAQPPYSQ